MSDPARGAEAEDAYGFPAGLWRWLQRHPPPALHRLTRFRSPLRGPWLTSVFGLVLLVALPFVIITGLAYAIRLVVAHVRRRRAGCSRVDAIDEE